MDKKQALEVLINESCNYKNNLLDRNLLFVSAKEQHVQCIETLFLDKHFLHLTGVNYEAKNPVDFYKKCLNKRLALNMFDFKPDGTTVLKLQVLKAVMFISKNAKMMGEYNEVKPRLFTEKVTGTTRACVGFTLDAKCGFYVPNTCLKEDARDMIYNPSRVVGILSKHKSECEYQTVEYIAKDVDIFTYLGKLDIAHNIKLAEAVPV